MRRLFFILSLLFFKLILLTNQTYAQKADSSAQKRSISSIPFEIGERLIFRLRYGFITAGRAEMKVLGLFTGAIGEYYHLQTTARSTRTFDWVYKVRDEVNVYLDAHTLTPLHFEKLLREGGYKADTFVDYFPEDSVAHVKFIRYKDGMKIKKKEEYDVKIPTNGVFDPLSAFYYIRTLPLSAPDTLRLITHEKRKVYHLPVFVYGPETVSVKAGKFRCWRLVPAVMEEGIFKHEGKVTIWLTDDDLRIPVKMTTKVIVGHITAELVSIKGISRKIGAKLN